MATAPSLVQAKWGEGPNSSTSISITLDTAPTSGNLLVVCMAGDKDTGSGSITGFTKEVELLETSVSLYIFWKVSDGTETSITVNHATTSIAGNAALYMEYSQPGSDAWALAAEASNNSDGTSVSTKSTGTTPATTHEGVGIAVAAKDSFATGDTIAWSNSYVSRYSTPDTENLEVGLWVADKVIAEGATTETTATLTGTADQMSAAVVVFGRSAASLPVTVVVSGVETPATAYYYNGTTEVPVTVELVS